MRGRGFMEYPVCYESPVVWYEERPFRAPGSPQEVEHRVVNSTFFLLFSREVHAFAFYTCWEGFHRQAGFGEEVIVLSLKNREYERTRYDNSLMRVLGNRHTCSADNFRAYLKIRNEAITRQNEADRQALGAGTSGQAAAEGVSLRKPQS